VWKKKFGALIQMACFFAKYWNINGRGLYAELIENKKVRICAVWVINCVPRLTWALGFRNSTDETHQACAAEELGNKHSSMALCIWAVNPLQARAENACVTTAFAQHTATIAAHFFQPSSFSQPPRPAAAVVCTLASQVPSSNLCCRICKLILLAVVAGMAH
jgi:hypothetical protein